MIIIRNGIACQMGENPGKNGNRHIIFSWGIAQLVEYCTVNAGVIGSNPIPPAISIPTHMITLSEDHHAFNPFQDSKSI